MAEGVCLTGHAAGFPAASRWSRCALPCSQVILWDVVDPQPQPTAPVHAKHLLTDALESEVSSLTWDGASRYLAAVCGSVVRVW